MTAAYLMASTKLESSGFSHLCASSIAPAVASLAIFQAGHPYSLFLTVSNDA
jgi:hypothetical protein